MVVGTAVGEYLRPAFALACLRGRIALRPLLRSSHRSAALAAALVAQLALMIVFYALGLRLSASASPWLVGMIGKIAVLTLALARIGGLSGSAWLWIAHVSRASPVKLGPRVAAQLTLEAALPFNLFVASFAYGALFAGRTSFAGANVAFAVAYSVSLSVTAGVIEAAVQWLASYGGRWRSLGSAVVGIAAAAAIAVVLTDPELVRAAIPQTALGWTPAGLVIDAALYGRIAPIARSLEFAAAGALVVIGCTLMQVAGERAVHRLAFSSAGGAQAQSPLAKRRSTLGWFIVKELRFARSWPLLWLRLHLAPIGAPLLLSRFPLPGGVSAGVVAIFAWGPLLMYTANMFGFQAAERRWMDAMPVTSRQELVCKHVTVMLLGHYALALFVCTCGIVHLSLPFANRYPAFLAAGGISVALGSVQSVMHPKPVSTSLGVSHGLKDIGTAMQAAAAYLSAVVAAGMTARPLPFVIVCWGALVAAYFVAFIVAARRMERHAFSSALQTS